MNSNKLKTEGLCWLRYSKKMDIVATEVGHWNADILGFNEKLCIEVEVKVSRSDIRAEFRNKRPKHSYYKSEHVSHWTPNYFYMLVPASLAEYAVEVLAENNPKYGVISLPDTEAIGVPGKKLTVVKKAQRLHSKPPDVNIRKATELRASSGLCGLYLMIDRINDNITEKLTDIRKEVTEMVKLAITQLPEGEEDETPAAENPL